MCKYDIYQRYVTSFKKALEIKGKSTISIRNLVVKWLRTTIQELSQPGSCKILRKVNFNVFFQNTDVFNVITLKVTKKAVKWEQLILKSQQP